MAGADAVKFQYRLLPQAIPKSQRDTPKTLANGVVVTYLEYKKSIELPHGDHIELADFAHSVGLDYGISVWDTVGPHIMADLGTYKDGVDYPGKIDFLKVPSAHMANEAIVHHTATRGLPFFWSTGMHDMEEIGNTTRWLDAFQTDNWGVFHCNSSYPASVDELNLRVIPAWQDFILFTGHPIGYSGHETGLATTIAAVALGASIIERHITLDRAAWGSDHAASVEPQGFKRMVKDIRAVEMALGDGKKVVYESEQAKRDSLTTG